MPSKLSELLPRIRWEYIERRIEEHKAAVKHAMQLGETWELYREAAERAAASQENP